MADGMFLSRDEVRRLTGRKKKDAQIRVLKAKGYRYDVDEDGHPVVMRADVERKFHGRATTPEPAPGPDFSAFPALR